MVWGLFPADSLSGEEKYYVFSKGTYKVGRKGCDIIINKDKGVSRIHAEITVAAMTNTSPLAIESSASSAKVLIRDCSKYGTFINKHLGSPEKVHEFPNKEATLKDCDMVSFGTGNAIYRFCFVPLVFYVVCSESPSSFHFLEEKVSSIGGLVTENCRDCTHVLVDHFIQVEESLLDAVVAKKHFVLSSWLEYLAEKKVLNEIPSYTSHLPTIVAEGASVKVAEPKTRETCLGGYTFLLEPTQMYKFGDRLQMLLGVAGAKIISVNEFHFSSQASEFENKQVVYVMPRRTVDSRSSKVSLLFRVNELDLVCAVLSGHLDTSSLISPAVIVSSSCSTDETVVADSEADDETATSMHVASPVHLEKHAVLNHSGKASPNGVVADSENDDAVGNKYSCDDIVAKCDRTATSMHPTSPVHLEKPTMPKDSGKASRNCVVAVSEDDHAMRECINNNIVIKSDRTDESAEGSSDIIYSQDLIVRRTTLPAISSVDGSGVNFKCFRKKNTPSGNSFDNLVPFSKFPYKESDYGNEQLEESVREEKKRKQMEAMAEDLFNNDKGRKRGVAGSLRRLLTHS
ncbi:nijmegen breakage syndrome 1 protein [Rhodamnia argentea]|uniref:Nijmegen breakage syndrome 1 protein n=1 Tax=Rhodamnia argentea TaxID=178133 RepID=A0A8B8NFD9_9MYRT|nr:nijmegen breakage syndrome 1 protein [Rhodamnia argentea]XP_030520750.2 nijmegen breakage syndrome 1 protein [Rhodamnia argentea]